MIMNGVIPVESGIFYSILPGRELGSYEFYPRTEGSRGVWKYGGMNTLLSTPPYFDQSAS